jgi:hypothetical protein
MSQTVKVLVEFETATTCDDPDKAWSNAAVILSEQLFRAGIINPDKPETAIFRARLISGDGKVGVPAIITPNPSVAWGETEVKQGDLAMVTVEIPHSIIKQARIYPGLDWNEVIHHAAEEVGITTHPPRQGAQ